MTEIPNKVKKYLTTYAKVIGEENLQLITEHISRCAALPSEPCENRLCIIAIRLRTISGIIGKPLDNLTEQDLQNLNLAMRERGYKSAQDYRKSLKRFLLLKDKKKYFDLIESEFLKAPKNKNKKKLVDPETFWSEKECNKYLEEAKNHSARFGAWASLWLSTGCRPHELLSLRKKDVIFENGALIVRTAENSKTGKRSIVLNGKEGPAVWHYVLPYIQKLQDQDLLFDCSYNAILKIHRKLCKLAKIGKDKAINLYMARKMRLTAFYNTYGLVKAASMAGHTPGSKSMRHYVGLTEEMMLTDGKLPNIEQKVCPNRNCGIENEPHFSNCQKCFAPLDERKFNGMVQTNLEEVVELLLKKHGLINKI